MKRIQTNLVSAFALLLIAFTAFAQEETDIIGNVREALKSSNSSELAKYLNNRVKIKLESERKEYSVNQAEIVLKQFFQKHPADAIEFIHEGNSPGGIIYAIGNYKSGNSTYRVSLRAKKYKKVYKIYHLEFENSR